MKVPLPVRARGGSGSRAEAAGDGAGRACVERPGAEQGSERTGCPDRGDTQGHAGDTENPAPCEPPYSGTPTGDARSGELRADLQRGSGPPPGRKRGSSPTGEGEAELRTVKRCFDNGPEWDARECGRGVDRGAGHVHLLSLFDGVGTAMLAMVELFAALGCQDRFAGGWFVETVTEDRLAIPVAKYWADRGRQGGPRFERVAGDVWDLLRNRGRALARMLAEVEPGAMLVIVGCPVANSSPSLGGTAAGRACAVTTRGTSTSSRWCFTPPDVRGPTWTCTSQWRTRGP